MYFVCKYLLINIIVVADAVVNNKNNFPICYPSCLLTRGHSQICKEDHGPSIFTCPAIGVRQNRIPSVAK